MSESSLGQKAAVIVGAPYVLIGIVGFFITGFGGFTQDSTDTLLFGASINPLHNLVHICVGAFLILMTRFGPTVAEGALLGVGLFYITAFVIGTVGATNLTIISMNGAGDGENFVHILTGVVALTAGLVAASRSDREAIRTGIPAS